MKDLEDLGFVVVPMTERTPNCVLQNNSPKPLSDIDRCVDELRDVLWALNEFIHTNPEVAFKEYKAHDALTTFMCSQNGWKVTPHACGIETAWTAIFDTGWKGPVLSFNVEMGQSISL